MSDVQGMFEYRDVLVNVKPPAEEVKEHRAEKRNTPEWAPLWAPTKQSLDYIGAIVQTGVTFLLGLWLFRALATRGVFATAARVAPG